MNLVLRKLKMLEENITAEELLAHKNGMEYNQTNLKLKNNITKILEKIEMV